jgi:2'-5' RNA ligase
MNGPASVPPSEPPEPARRLFYALWPESGTLDAVARVMRRLVPQGTGRPQRRDQLHLTLEFLGAVPESRLPRVLEVGAALAGTGAGFEILFDRLEHWKRPQVLCLTATVTPEPLAALVMSLRSQLLARGFDPEKRPFKAHLTLARKVRRPPPILALEPLGWPAREFSLVESTTDPSGSCYERLATWPLARE